MSRHALVVVCLVLTACLGGCGTAATPTTPTATGPLTFTFSTTLTPGASASRSFEQLATGVVTLTLSVVSPDTRLGIGIGIPRPDGIGCVLTHGVETSAGATAQIATTAEPGVWCVRAWDVGAVAERVSFTLGVTHY